MVNIIPNRNFMLTTTRLMETIPKLSLVMLVGLSGSGKSKFARRLPASALLTFPPPRILKP
jgi:ABC-type proline/glycine betaine transport system ATPase subunit